MLVEDIVRRVRETAGDITALQFSQTTLTDWINDGIRECVIENSLLQARGTTPSVVGQTDYNLPVDIFKLHSVYFDDRRLQIITLQEWEEMWGPDPSPGNSAPQVCYIYAGSLTVWPPPDSVATIKINYTKLPTAITYTAAPDTWTPTSPPINEAYHNRLVAYCLAQIALQDEDNYKYTMLMQEFKTGVRDTRDSANEDDLYPFISVSPRDSGVDSAYFGNGWYLDG